MLPSFLTTALEIIIILDVCGVIAYFTITGLTRIKDKKENPSSASSMLATDGIAMPSPIPVPARVSASVYQPVESNTSSQEPPKNQWTAGLKQRLTSITRTFTYRPTPGGKTVETQNLDTNYAKLGRVLDSFKEET